jgi:hypothetical protein
MVMVASPSIYCYIGGPFADDGLVAVVVDAVVVVVVVAAAVVAFAAVVGVAVSVGFSTVGEPPAVAAPPSALVADLGSSALDTGFKGVVPRDGRAAPTFILLL